MTGIAVSILIVEDDNAAGTHLQRLLVDLGYDAYAIASSAEEAVLAASKRRPDAVLVAVGLKGTLDGIDAAQLLRSRFNVPVFYLSEQTDDAVSERARKSAPYGFLLKPVQSAELRSVIELGLHRHKQDHEGDREGDPESHGRKESSSPPGRAVVGATDAQLRPVSPPPLGRSTRRPTVLLADDHTVVREGLVKLLVDHDFTVVGSVGDGHQLIIDAIRLRPDVIVTDISMPPGPSGLDVLAQLKAARVESKIIMLTMHDDPELAARATRAGASGFLLKLAAGDELVAAIHQVLQDGIYLTPSLTKDVIERLAANARPAPTLTARQVEVLRLILDGHRMKEIGSALDLSTGTVETHKYEMMRTLGVSSTAELVRYAIEHRLIVE